VSFPYAKIRKWRLVQKQRPLIGEGYAADFSSDDRNSLSVCEHVTQGHLPGPVYCPADPGLGDLATAETIPAIIDATEMNPPRKLYLRNPKGGILPFFSRDKTEIPFHARLYAVYYVAGPSRYAAFEFEVLKEGT